MRLLDLRWVSWVAPSRIVECASELALAKTTCAKTKAALQRVRCPSNSEFWRSSVFFGEPLADFGDGRNPQGAQAPGGLVSRVGIGLYRIADTAPAPWA